MQGNVKKNKNKNHFSNSPWQKHRLGLWEAIAVMRKEGMAAVAGVFIVRVVRAVGVKLLLVVVGGALAVHGPEEPQDEHDHPQHHAAQGEGLQAALRRGQEGGGAARHDEEGADENGTVVQGRHPPDCEVSAEAERMASLGYGWDGAPHVLGK